jgi:oxygen-dependent protoporphyrinogen oxidase
LSGVPEVGAVVIGAGIAGLAAAFELQKETSEVVVIDASDRPGGVLRTDHVAGYVIERGPNTVQVKAPMLGLLRRLKLESSLRRADPESRRRCLFRDGRLEPIPMSPLGFLKTPLLSGRGKLRLLAEPLMRRRDAAGESVADFAGRRLGAEAVAGLVGPFLTGVYAGDEQELGAEAVFGGLVDLERRYGSIALGALLRRRPRSERGLRGSYSGTEGMGPLARKLAELLVEPPALGSRVTGLRREDGHWRIGVSGPGGDRRFRARRVVVATPAYEAAEILRGLGAEVADGLAAIDYAPVLGIPLGVDPAEVRTPIEGFGFLVPRDAGVPLLGTLFMSRMFRNRAPEGRELLQCLAGGRRWPEAIDLPDDVVVRQILEDLDRILGLRSEPRVLAVTRWRRAIPQPDREHVRRIAAIRAALARFPGVALAGAYLDGVSVPDALASGIRAVRDLGGEASGET